MPRTIALLTDFGLSDPYVGQMKGVLARLAPGLAVLDISHRVAPFDLAQAGFFLAASAPHFPEDAVFVAVVDPGVGTDRRIVAVERGEQIFLVPDNGLLGLVLEEPRPLRAFDLSAAVPPHASATFQGRDVFAPLAAHMGLGVDPAALGPQIGPETLARLPWSRARAEGGVLQAHVLHVDRFGNCALNVRADGNDLGRERSFTLSLPARRPVRLVRTYADLAPSEIGILAGSQGFYELAVNQGSAARLLGLKPGDDLSLTRG